MFIHINADTEIYRGRSQHNTLLGNWYTLDIESARCYGNIIGKYKIKNNLKLLNVLSREFHIDFNDKLTLEYPGTNNDGIDINKMMLMVPIGLPDINFQMKVASTLLPAVSSIPSDPDFLSFWKTTNNVSRFSEYSLDNAFTQKIIELYGTNCDGFILPLKCHNIPQGGLFHREMYIHNTANVEYISDIHIQTAGGSQIKITKPLRFFKSDDELLKFKQKLQESYHNPFADNLIQNGWVTGEFDSIQKKRYTRKNYNKSNIEKRSATAKSPFSQ